MLKDCFNPECKNTFLIPLYHRGNIKKYCSYICGQKHYIAKHRDDVYKKLLEQKQKCEISKCINYYSSLAGGKYLCQEHYNEVKMKILVIQ